MQLTILLIGLINLISDEAFQYPLTLCRGCLFLLFLWMLILENLLNCTPLFIESTCLTLLIPLFRSPTAAFIIFNYFPLGPPSCSRFFLLIAFYSTKNLKTGSHSWITLHIRVLLLLYWSKAHKSSFLVVICTLRLCLVILKSPEQALLLLTLPTFLPLSTISLRLNPSVFLRRFGRLGGRFWRGREVVFGLMRLVDTRLVITSSVAKDIFIIRLDTCRLDLGLGTSTNRALWYLSVPHVLLPPLLVLQRLRSLAKEG
mmetsp:Transcript_17043/g.27085  ORF Transcript_17043/g.27085 Transcript_17043/m.27085 type:complete len:258 (+) Transcript_17043:133-906(+)